MRHFITSVVVASTLTSMATADAWHFRAESVAWAPASGTELLVDLIQRSTEPGNRHVLIRFDRPPGDAARSDLADAGVHVLSPLGGASYVARLDHASLHPAAVLQASNVLELRDIEPVWKLDPSLTSGEAPRWALSGANARSANPDIPVYLMLHQGIDFDRSADDVATRALGRRVSSMTSINAMVAIVPFDMVWTLAEDDRVLYVEPALPQLRTQNDSNRVITEVNTLQASPYGLDGSGVSVMVYDGGKSALHGDFGGRLTQRDASGTSDHGTHVSGTIGGDGSGSGGTHRGMAPACIIESYGFEQEGGLSEGFLYTDPGDIEADYGDAINNHGCVLANNSIGTNTASNGFPCEWTGNYGVTSNLIDHVARGGLGGDIRIVWANGNERSTSNCGNEFNTTAPPACAKNHITVGALNSNDDSVTYFTSWGPTDDGRIKPDVSAPGCQSDGDGGVTSCSSGGGYSSKCGTSMASPTVCGISALILQDWRAQYPERPDMAGHTLKALLAHTAFDGGNIGPDCKYGYGSVRAQAAIDHLRMDNIAEKTITDGETQEVLIFVEQGQSTVKATIAWNDVPGTPLVEPSLVNNIDLKIIGPDGITHWPWTLVPGDPGAPAVRNGPDSLNNIEQVQIDNAQPGVYRVVISGTSIAEGPQQYGLQASPLLVNCSSAGQASLSGTLVPCDATVGLRVVDCDLDLDPDQLDFVDVQMSSSSGDSIALTLVETGTATAAFVAEITLGDDLIAGEGDEISMKYIDADDGNGGTDVPVTATAIVDCTSADLLSVSVSDIGPFTAMVNVASDEESRVDVYYGTSCAGANDVQSSNGFDLNHEIELGGLTEDTDWYIYVVLTDRAGNVSTFDNVGTCWSFSTLNIPNYFTEQFGGFDLDGTSITFSPNGSFEAYDACIEEIDELWVSPDVGDSISLGDDDYATRSASSSVQLFGVSHNTMYIGSNGMIRFDQGSNDYTEDLSEHFGAVQIAMLWDDLNPSSGGTVRFADLNDRAVVTFDSVPEYSSQGSNTFQCEMFYDGVLRLSWLGVSSDDSIVGLSRGDGTPDSFIESDFTMLADCNDILMGDVNQDGIVSVDDLLMVISIFGPCQGCPEDIDGDGLAGVTDILIILANWGMSG